MRSIFGRSGISSGFGRKRGGGGAFALTNAQWTVIERPEDANRKRPQVDIYAEPPAGTRFLASRTANPNGIPTSGNFAELTFIGVGHYRWQGSSQVTSAEEQIVVWTVASDVSAPVPTMVLGAPNPAVTRVSLNKPFQPSGVPFAPAFTYYADGSGTAAQIRLSPRAVNEGNGRNGVTPWRAVDQL
uniref:hypothetical protein n=1 Tax=Neotabrizicola sp. sgz301269 TaxID=3276282 RepID=UPI00377064CD